MVQQRRRQRRPRTRRNRHDYDYDESRCAIVSPDEGSYQWPSAVGRNEEVRRERHMKIDCASKRKTRADSLHTKVQHCGKRESRFEGHCADFECCATVGNAAR
ncbi:uncharacterized protein LOC118506716 [Anopheles stephensi]|uniref:uncharacterized protein LOC118506716 n=1 Tax=Anopheles stephensi TaxID=30069 RepID=UPI001658A17E|nr:uncharacterized protein LOC118506716 [Anopheles stephensi]